MTTQPFGRIDRCALWIAGLLVPVGFFALLLWLKPQSQTLVQVLASLLAIFVMGYSLFLDHRMQRRLDEVQIAGHGFANSHGRAWGASAAILLLMLPPVTNWLIDLANMLSTGSPDRSNRATVQLAFFFGLILVVLIQVVAIVVASAIWQRRMGGVRDPS